MQKLGINDYNIIKKYLDIADYEGYNSNFVTMMMWNHEYHVEYEIHDNYMIMLQHYEDCYYFAMPFCKKEYYQEAIDYMISYASKHGFPFLMDCVIQEVRDEIKKIYGNRLLSIATPYNDDYIYTKEALVSLSGKKMQKRRNHFNAFLKENTDFIYKEIENNDIDNVLSCLKRWDNEHRNEESVQSEFIGIIYLLMHRDILGIKTGCIYINGALEAFIIGSPLKHQTIQIHVEKANKEIRGLYVAICKYFLENNYPEYVYVNREEDMGLDSLRQAKRALHPIKMITKYSIKENDVSITKANREDKESIIQLWQENFTDEDQASTDFYFSTCYKEENTFVLKSKDTLITVIQIVPYTIVNKGVLETVYFILGVSTKSEFQRNGCMKMALEHILSLEPYASHRIFLQAYTPSIYYPFGFNEQYFHQVVKVDSASYDKDVSILAKPISVEQLISLYTAYCKQFTGYRLRDKEYYQSYLIPRCAAYQDSIVGIYQKDILLGYCIYHEDDTSITITECIYQEQYALDAIISHFACNEKDLIIECDTKANIVGETKTICTMLTNDISSQEDEKVPLFINETL